VRRQLAAGLTAVALAVAVSGCSTSSPKADLQSRSNDVVAAANAGDAPAVRGAANRMLTEIQKQHDAGDLSTTKAHALQVLLERIVVNAGDLEPTESPSPEPSPSESPSPEPSPSPSPAASPSPEPSPPPSPSQAPPSPDVVPSVLSPQPIAPQAGQPSSQAS
jgi:hypothetical protein